MKAFEIILSALIGMVLSLLIEGAWFSQSIVFWVVGAAAAFYSAREIARWWLADSGAERLAAFMAKGGSNRMYHDALQGALDRLDGLLCPPEYLDRKDARFVLPLRAGRAWNWKAYDNALLFSLIYPIGIPIQIWLISGTKASLGSFEILQQRNSFFEILLSWSVIVLCLFSRTIIQRTLSIIFKRTKLSERTIFLAQIAMMAAIAVAIGVYIFSDQSDSNILAAAFVIAAIAAFNSAFVVASIGACAIAMATAFAKAGAAVTVVSGAVAVSIAIAFSITLNVTYGTPTDIELVVAVIMTIFFAYAVHAVLRSHFYSNVVMVALTATMLGALIFATTFTSPVSLIDAPVLLLFLGLFPITNAVWDFLSLGLTRWCLRRSLPDLSLPGKLPREVRPVVYWAVDLAGAILALLGLIASLAIGIHVMNAAASEPILPLAELMADLRPGADGPDMAWFYIMVFSTLLPTALHFALFALSLILRFPGKRFIRQLAQVPEGDAEARGVYVDRAATGAGVFALVFGVLPLAGFVYLVPGVGTALEGVIWGIVAYAEWVIGVFGLR